MTIKIEKLNIDEESNRDHSESDEPPTKEAPIDEAQIEPTPKRQSKKQQEYVSCPHCNKSMLLKTFKYYNSYKCKPEVPQPVAIKQAVTEKIEVAFNEFQSKSRKDQRNDSIKRLMSKAF